MQSQSIPAKRAPQPWPKRLRRVLQRMLVLLLLLLGVKGAWFFGCRANVDRIEQRRAELLARRAYLLHRVTAPDFGPRDFPAALGSQFQGEWALVSLSMTALALGGLAQEFPDAAVTTERDLDQIISRALSKDLSSFDTGLWQEPALTTLAGRHGHVGYLGHLALILAVRELSFPGSPHRALLKRLTEALVHKIEKGPCGLAETYPGELYVPDNAVALAALALAARAGIGPNVAPGLLQKLHARYAAPTTGLLPFRLNPDCQAVDHERSSGAAWNLLYLGLVDEDYVQRSYQALQALFLDRPLPGLWGLREWPRGVDRGGDVDSGPLPWGLSPAGTGFTIASAQRLGDVWTVQRMLDTAELAGFSFEVAGRRRYLLAPLVGDAIVLAARAPLQRNRAKPK